MVSNIEPTAEEVLQLTDDEILALSSEPQEEIPAETNTESEQAPFPPDPNNISQVAQIDVVDRVVDYVAPRQAVDVLIGDGCRIKNPA